MLKMSLNIKIKSIFKGLFLLSLFYGNTSLALNIRCVEKMEKIGTSPPTSDDFPIEQFYHQVRVDVGPGGQLLYSKGAKAYILWRSRTPLNIPDDRFASHYMTKDQMVLMVSLHESTKEYAALGDIPQYLKPVETNPFAFDPKAYLVCHSEIH